MKKSVLKLLLGLTLATIASLAHAQTTQAIDEQHLRVYLQNELSGAVGRADITIGDVDTRLHLAPCARIEPFLPAGARLWGRGMIGVRCLEGATWSTYIPIHVRIYGPAVVAARGLSAGQALSPADVREEEVELTREPPGVLNDPAQVENKLLLRTLTMGQPIRGDQLRARPVVVSGEQVKLTYTGGGFMVSAEGRALAPAVDGQSVRVQLQSGRVLTGTARAGGVVEIRS
jgi:flagella basal body P-ring formation protein FlgA